MRKALTVGEIDGYPEYTATALNLFFKGQTIPPAALASGTVGWALAKSLDASNGVTWLAAAPANNTFTVAITKKLSDEKNIKTMADLAKYVNGGGQIEDRRQPGVLLTCRRLPVLREGVRVHRAAVPEGRAGHR